MGGCSTVPGWDVFCYNYQCFRRVQDEMSCAKRADGIVANADGSWCMEKKYRDFQCPRRGISRSENPAPGNAIPLGDIGFVNGKTPHEVRQPCTTHEECGYAACAGEDGKRLAYCYGQRCISRKENAPE